MNVHTSLPPGTAPAQRAAASPSPPAGTLIVLLILGVFSIINTEMGVIGIVPLIAEHFGVSVPQAGWTVGAFALVIALSAPVLPLLFSGFERRQVMLLALGTFTVANMVAAFTDDFAVLLAARIVPAFMQPVYVSMAFTVAAASVPPEQAPRAVARVFIGVSAGMVLGVPATTFIASHTSFSTAMLCFAGVNAVVFLATLRFIPRMPVPARLSRGDQLRVLRKPLLWHSIAAAFLINGAVFGFFSYLSDFLHRVTQMDFNTISIVLLLYGCANIVGNVVAGRLLARRPALAMLLVPAALLVCCVLLFLFGRSSAISAMIVGGLGVLAGMAANLMQYMITQAAPEAPDFANGLFLTAVNLGVTAGAAFCGALINLAGTAFTPWGAVLMLAVSFLPICLRMAVSRRQPAVDAAAPAG